MQAITCLALTATESERVRARVELLIQLYQLFTRENKRLSTYVNFGAGTKTRNVARQPIVAGQPVEALCSDQTCLQYKSCYTDQGCYLYRS